MTSPSRDLETFPNPHPNRDYEIEIVCPEFTALCPITGQPDFGTIRITYTPGPRCVELKSLKLYIWSYRQEGAFYEDVVNRILDDLVAACDPRQMTVLGQFNVRGGISTNVTARYRAPV
jgi:7-cyano-7-deazaguanine reductase